MLRILPVVLFSLALFPFNANADVELIHQPSYREGQKIRTEVEISNDQTLIIAGMNTETQVNNYVVTEETVSAVESGKVTLDSKIAALQMELNLPGGINLNFDSGNPDATDAPAGPLGDMVKFFKQSAGAQWKTTIDENGKVAAVKYADGYLENIPEMFKGETDPEEVIKKANMMLDRLPGKSVAVGDTWKRNEEFNLGQGQVFHLERTYTYLGQEEHNGKSQAKIGMKTTSIEYTIGGGNLPISVKSSELKVKSSEGTVWVDTEAKAITEVNDSMAIEGELVLVANGQELPSELDLKMNIKTKIARD